MHKGKKVKHDFVQSSSHTDTVGNNRLQNDTVGGDRSRLNTHTVITTGGDDHLSPVVIETQDKYDLALRFKAKLKTELTKQKTCKFFNFGINKLLENLVTYPWLLRWSGKMTNQFMLVHIYCKFMKKSKEQALITFLGQKFKYHLS